TRFAKLRAASHDDQAAALAKVADEFEALFVDLMLKAARQATPGDGLFDSQAGDTYQEMFDQQMAQSIAAGQDLGIGRALERQFRAFVGTDEAAQAEAERRRVSGEAGAQAELNPLRRYLGPSPYPEAVSASAPTRSARNRAAQAAAADDPRAGFIAALGGHAEQAGRALGVPPRAILAQAALETGWGQHLMRHADGRSAHNYFGIKAGGGWHGPVVRVPTTEYVNGRAMTVTANFRAYDTPAAAFRDYVDFIRDNPRYREALTHGANEGRYARELAAAGYATDPAYAEKIIAIIETGDWTMYPGAAPNPDPDQGS
ncbi:MAG: flagellar assembly peptidoglycan hydrolase FlgJ, partial [Gammaproteobacteria bacterium]|nr:flagellar assembly peptidoglycan hydrolase FlgJ [Gammaproteobacteria bacterium]